MRERDRFRGCLIGGAAGDALGYAVEFLREGQIFSRYGAAGIQEYALTGGVAQISDDTQMTLFTATGLLRAAADGTEDYAGLINSAYLDWLKTQEMRRLPPRGKSDSWLMNVSGLYSPRAPGNTCLAALRAGGGGTPEQPINESKGCGGVMRVAPIGLYFNDRQKDIRSICRLGAEAAALTHGHTLGWLPAAALAQIIHEVSQDSVPVPDAALHALTTVENMWPDTPDRRAFASLIRKAVDLSSSAVADLDAIHRLGEGWVGEEALAIAVFCACRHQGDIDGALKAAVNHHGDSDSTGAIAGNIVGAQVGLEGIPAKYTEKLELRDLIIEVADDLWQDRPISGCDGEADDVWEQKYLHMTYAPDEPL